MMYELSANTKAILLLTAPLLAGRNSRAEVPLSIKEYNQLASRLRSIQHQPVDLLTQCLDEILGELQPFLAAMPIG
jgi:hypothetical protein